VQRICAGCWYEFTSRLDDKVLQNNSSSGGRQDHLGRTRTDLQVQPEVGGAPAPGEDLSRSGLPETYSVPPAIAPWALAWDGVGALGSYGIWRTKQLRTQRNLRPCGSAHVGQQRDRRHT
jgi:hypothetical protein